MKIPLLDITPQLSPLREEIQAAIMDVVDSNAFILGPKVSELESAVAEYSGVAHAFGVSSGTDALLLALMALDVGPDDLVVTTPFSFFATAGVIARLGATPVFVDIEPDSFNMNPELLGAYLGGLSAKEISRVKAIMPVHLYGQCANMDAILESANRYSIAVVEDAAQAIGAEYPSKDGVRRAGVMGAIGCFSFYPSKNLGAVGDAGMIITNDEALAERIRVMRVHGEQKKYHHGVVGGNFRMDGIQGAVLLVKLAHLDTWHKGRRENAATYRALFAERGLREVTLPREVYGESGIGHPHIYNQFAIRALQRDDLKAHLQGHGVGCEVYYPVPFHRQECFAYLDYASGDFPESERAAAETLALPIYPELTDEMLSVVVERIAEFHGV